MKRTAIFLLLLTGIFANAQNQDSLLQIAKGNSADTSKIKALTTLASISYRDDINAGLAYAKRAFVLADSIHETGNYRAMAMYQYGLALNMNGQFDSAVKYLNWAETIYARLGNKRKQADCFNSLGNSAGQQGKYSESLSYYFKALGIYSDLANEKRQSVVLGNIANTYANMDDAPNAIKYYEKSIVLKEKLNDTETLLSSYANIAGVYLDLGQLDKANEYADKAGKISENYGDKADSVFLINLRGKIALEKNDLPKALQMFNMAVKLAGDIGDRPSIGSGLLNIGLTYIRMRDTVKANEYINRGFAELRLLNEQPIIEDAYEAVADQYAEIGETAVSYRLLKTLLNMQDTAHSAELSELIAKKEAEFNLERKQHDLDLQIKKGEINDLELERSKYFIAFLVVAVFLVLVGLAFLFSRNRAKQNVNEQLERQNAEITLQKKSITDSINYAKKIQDSILPPEKQIQRVLPDGFILYEPKDVVSGDFYWLDSRDGLSIFAAVDCTGHGVPGALMSVIGFNLLNQAVNEMGITKPSDILHHLDFGVNKLLRQSDGGNTVKDGMDLGLCTYDPVTKKLQFAGVFNPAYIITKGVLKQINADKFPIGINVDGITDDYTNNEIQLYTGDMVYLFSDGYADQFGGPMGKKFKYNRFRELLIKIQSLPAVEQRDILRNEFVSWRGNLEQVDDILVIGMRVN